MTIYNNLQQFTTIYNNLQQNCICYICFLDFYKIVSWYFIDLELLKSSKMTI